MEYIWCISNIRKLTYLPFILFLKELHRQAASLILNCISATKFNSNFLNERMGKTTDDAYRYPYAVVLVVGILGNILVIISILRQKKLLKNNYYFLVLHLTICDLVLLIIFLFDHINWYYVEDRLVITYTIEYCVFSLIYLVFRVAGLGMMLIISVLRYRATVHPLKPDVSRRKLNVVCGLVYIVGFILGYGPDLPLCFLQWNDVVIFYDKVLSGYTISCFYFFPTIFMAVVYYKIGRELIKQKRYMKSVCSNPVRRGDPDSSFNILKFIRNRRTFFVCLITVLCYGIGNIPITVYFILSIAEEDHFLMKYFWIGYLADVVRVAGSHSVNPLIYGKLDKKLLTFWKLCCKKKQRPQGN